MTLPNTSPLLTKAQVTQPIRDISESEWRLILRIRQIRRSGERSQILVDPVENTLKIVSERAEKL